MTEMSHQERHGILMAWCAEHGIRPVRNQMVITPEMSAAAMKWHHEREGRAADAEIAKWHEANKDRVFATERGCPLVEPGQGSERVAILCGGPSLSKTWDGAGEAEDWSAVLAVNCAGEGRACDWWVTHDPGPLTEYDVAPRVGIATAEERATQLLDGTLRTKSADIGSLLIARNNRLGTPAIPTSLNWSTFYAMLLAARLGASEIVLFGDDKSGATYHDGRPMQRNVMDDRWKRERENFEWVDDRMKAAGVRIERRQPEDT